MIKRGTPDEITTRLNLAVNKALSTPKVRQAIVKLAAEVVEACRADPKGDDRQITEKVNEMAVAKVLLVDQAITWPITYEPNLLPDGRKIDFVVDRGADNLYIEVKTVRPRTADTEAAWEKFLARRRRHPQNVNVILEKDWMGAGPFTATCSRRARTFSITRWILKRASPPRRRSNPVTAS